MASTPDRQAALAAALRANLRRRKTAARPASEAETAPPAEGDGGAADVPSPHGRPPPARA